MDVLPANIFEELPPESPADICLPYCPEECSKGNPGYISEYVLNEHDYGNIHVKSEPVEEGGLVRYVSYEEEEEEDSVTGSDECPSMYEMKSTRRKNGQNPHAIDYKCMSKSAIAARENRMKKKLYLKKIEEAYHDSSAKNKILSKENVRLKKMNENLVDEVAYLRSVLANVDQISSLIKCVKKEPKVNLIGASIKKEVVEGGEVEDKISMKGTRKSVRLTSKVKNGKAGVCFHILNGSVSLEFCKKCSISAQSV